MLAGDLLLLPTAEREFPIAHELAHVLRHQEGAARLQGRWHLLGSRALPLATLLLPVVASVAVQHGHPWAPRPRRTGGHGATGDDGPGSGERARRPGRHDRRQLRDTFAGLVEELRTLSDPDAAAVQLVAVTAEAEGRASAATARAARAEQQRRTAEQQRESSRTTVRPRRRHARLG